jgi:hypothetical protein
LEKADLVAMYPSSLDPSTEELGPLAKEIRAYLVEVRGGAPFLSGADAHLLVHWLESSVPVPLILACIDRVAARRRKKRVRSRLTLKACRGEVNRALKKQAARHTSGVLPSPEAVPSGAQMPEASPEHSRELLDLVAELDGVDVEPELQELWSVLRHALTELAAPGLSIEERTTRVMGAVRIFHRDAWDAMSAFHEELREAAREELGPLEGAVSERIFLELLEEAARDQLRRRFVLVSADRLWDRLQP